MSSQLITIVKKEMLDATRDGKSLATVLFLPVFFAAVLFGMLQFVAKIKSEARDLTVAVQGAERVAPLMQWLREQGVEIDPAPENPLSAVKNGQIQLALVVSDDFVENFRQQDRARLDLIYDHSDSELQAKVGHLKRLIEHWGSRLGALRLITRGVSPAVANPVEINEINTASDQRIAAKILSGLPMFFVMIVFASGIGMASDMAAGERERKTLEPLLINPVNQATVFMGKWMACMGITFAITLLGAGLQFLAVGHAPLAELGLRVDLGLYEFSLIVLLLLPVIFLACALQLFVSLFARSFKDAQTYNSLVIMLPILPGVYMMLTFSGTELWQMFVPVLGQQALVVDIISGEAIAISHMAIASVTALVWAGVLARMSVQVLRRERTLFA